MPYQASVITPGNPGVDASSSRTESSVGQQPRPDPARIRSDNRCLLAGKGLDGWLVYASFLPASNIRTGAAPATSPRLPAMRYWLMKSEPDEFSIDDLAAAKGQTTPWFGVRNYQARNFMRDQMRSATARSSTIRAARSPESPASSRSSRRRIPTRRSSTARARTTTPKATRDAPRWVNVDVKFVGEAALVPLAELRAHPELARMRVLQRGNRLSVTPVDPAEWAFVEARERKGSCQQRSALSRRQWILALDRLALT